MAGGMQEVKVQVAEKHALLLAPEQQIHLDRFVRDTIHACRSEEIVLPLDSGPVHLVGDDLGAVLLFPGVKAADVVDMAMGGDDMPDLSRLPAHGPYVLLDSLLAVAYTGIDHHQLRPGIDHIDVGVLRGGEARASHGVDPIANRLGLAHRSFTSSCWQDMTSSIYTVSAFFTEYPARSSHRLDA